MMNAETLLACLNTLQISRGKDIIRVRDIKEIPNQGWNYTMDYKIKNSRHDFMETSFNNLIPSAAFNDFIRDNPEAHNITSTEGLHKPVPKITHQNVDEVQLSPAGSTKLIPGDVKNPIIVNEKTLTSDPNQGPVIIDEVQLTPGDEQKPVIVDDSITILTEDGETRTTNIEYHQKMIGKYGEANLPYTVIGKAGKSDG